jgi:YegS/Rv2252/BmrU family lipid kinase
MPQLYVIVNPIAGKGAGRRHLDRIRHHLRAHDLDFALCETQAPRHAIELAHQASIEGIETVVAVGGDGTANEVLNGLMQAKGRGGGATLGVIGVGTGNDFAYGTGLPAGIDAACHALAQGRTRWIDVCHVRGGDWSAGRYVGNGVGVGFDVTTTLEVQKIKHLTGMPAYLLAVLKTMLLYYSAPTITVQADDRTLRDRYLMISAMNGRRFGGGFLVAPQACPDDGLFDLVLTTQPSRLVMLRLMVMYMRGTQLAHPKVEGMRARDITITASGALNSHADGEIFMIGGDQIELEMLPQQIQVIGPFEESV